MGILDKYNLSGTGIIYFQKKNFFIKWAIPMYWLILGQSPTYWSCLDLWGLWLSICLKATLDHTVFKTPRFFIGKNMTCNCNTSDFFLFWSPKNARNSTKLLLMVSWFSKICIGLIKTISKKISLLNLFPENNDIITQRGYFVNYGYFQMIVFSSCARILRQISNKVAWAH